MTSPNVFPLKTERGISLKVIPSAKSAVEKIGVTTPLPVAHLILVGDDENLTWEAYDRTGLGRGELLNVASRNMYAVAKHFLPTLEAKNVAWRFEMNSNNAASRATVHLHIIVGHEDLFGKDGVIRRCVDDIRKPEIIERDT